MSTPQHKLDQTIADLMAKTERLKAIREALDNEDVQDELREIFGGTTPKRTVKKAKGKKPGAYEKIREFFANRSNEWATISDLEAIKIYKGTARQVLYKSKPHEFERESVPGGARETKFRLKKPDSQGNGKPQRTRAHVEQAKVKDNTLVGKTIAEAAKLILAERPGEAVYYGDVAVEAQKRGYASARKDSSDKAVRHSFFATMKRMPNEIDAIGDGKFRLKESAK